MNCVLCQLPVGTREKIRCTCKLSKRERRLPHWAQAELDHVRTRFVLEQDRRRSVESANVLLKDRDWFTLSGPTKNEGTGTVRYLWWDIQHAACSLGLGDVLLVGRIKR